VGSFHGLGHRFHALLAEFRIRKNRLKDLRRKIGVAPKFFALLGHAPIQPR
jgi:hypothetical protein